MLIFDNILLYQSNYFSPKDGGCAPFLPHRNADSAFGGRSGLQSDSRDPVDEPMSFVSFTAEARVSFSLTNPRPCFAHVDAMKRGEEAGHVVVVGSCPGLH